MLVCIPIDQRAPQGNMENTAWKIVIVKEMRVIPSLGNAFAGLGIMDGSVENVSYQTIGVRYFFTMNC